MAFINKSFNSIALGIVLNLTLTLFPLLSPHVQANSKNPMIESNKAILLNLEDNLFVRIPVPDRGIVSSNQQRIERISKLLENPSLYEIPWGPRIYTGTYKGQKVFMASAPVGSGSGLMFTELYSAGAKYIIRYGSDDVKDVKKGDENLVKIIDETDNLYGFNQASGLPESEWGKSLFASPQILIALKEEASSRKLKTQTGVCHHLENYHALRTPDKFAPPRKEVLEEQLKNLKRKNKAESMDMESAVLFRVAHDYNLHAATVLQTVNKENKKLGPYEGKNKEQALQMEPVFTDFLMSALLRLP